MLTLCSQKMLFLQPVKTGKQNWSLKLINSHLVCLKATKQHRKQVVFFLIGVICWTISWPGAGKFQELTNRDVQHCITRQWKDMWTKWGEDTHLLKLYKPAARTYSLVSFPGRPQGRFVLSQTLIQMQKVWFDICVWNTTMSVSGSNCTLQIVHKGTGVPLSPRKLCETFLIKPSRS